MNMVMPNEGKLWLLDDAFRLTTTRESFVLDLFQNNVTVGDSSTAASFTVATFTGYAQIAISRSQFSAAVIAANIGTITSTFVPTWTCTGGSAQTVYGWILRSQSTNKVIFGQNFDNPRSMVASSQEALNPFTLKDKTFV